MLGSPVMISMCPQKLEDSLKDLNGDKHLNNSIKTGKLKMVKCQL